MRNKGNGAKQPMSGGEAAPKKDRLANLRPAWQPGKSGNPAGRPKGARNKLGEEFLEALADSFHRDGADAIERVRVNDPVQYVKVIASILPREVTVTTYADMSDEELDQRIKALAAQLNIEVVDRSIN